MSTESTPLAERMQAARKDSGLNKTQIAALIGCTEGAVRMWESGQRDPRTKYLRAWAEVTGKPLAWFFEEVAA